MNGTDIFMTDGSTIRDAFSEPGLPDTHSEEFEALYLDYENRGKGRKTIKARELWEKITESQIETGTPYMLYKDAANRILHCGCQVGLDIHLDTLMSIQHLLEHAS